MTKSEFLFEKLQIEKPWHLDLDDFDAKLFLIKFRELNSNTDNDIWIDIAEDLKWKAKLFIGTDKEYDFYSLDFKNCILDALLHYYNYEQEFEKWQDSCIKHFQETITNNMVDPDPRIDELVNKNFWELLHIEN